MTKLQIDYQTMVNTKKHNQAMLAEAQRSNRANEAIGWQNANTNWYNALTREGELRNAEQRTTYDRLHQLSTTAVQSAANRETARHNEVMEAETSRHNAAVESETARKNLYSGVMDFAQLAANGFSFVL